MTKHGDILGPIGALPVEPVYTAQEAAARDMLAALEFARLHIGPHSNIARNKVDAAIAAAKAAGIEASS